MALETPIEVGFSEFVAKLVSEVFDSIITAQGDQEERNAALLTAAELTAEQFARQHVADQEVNAALSELFPPRKEDGERQHTVYEGSLYAPAGGDGKESPPYQELAGVSLEKKDVKEREQGFFVLTASGVEKIVTAVRLRIASGRVLIMRQLAVRGLPRVVVDSGRINAKMTFRLLSTEEPAPKADNGTVRDVRAVRPLSAATMASLRLQPTDLRSIVGIPKAAILPDVKLLVRQADERAPETSQVKANVFGEVEITFKTVS